MTLIKGLKLLTRRASRLTPRALKTAITKMMIPTVSPNPGSPWPGRGAVLYCRLPAHCQAAQHRIPASTVSTNRSMKMLAEVRGSGWCGSVKKSTWIITAPNI